MSILIAACLIAAFFTSCGKSASQSAPERQASSTDGQFATHCVLLRAGEIEALVGDGERIRNHPGLWLLASKHSPFNVAHNKSAMMLGGGLRNRHPRLEQLDENSCRLVKSSTPDDPSDIRAVFRISAPCYLDYEHNIRDTENRIPPELGYRSLAWANYTNSPDDLRIHFLSNGEWFAWTPEQHGGPGSQVVPSYLPKDKLETWPPNDPDPAFWWYKRLGRGFDEPFFYGRFEDMVLIWVFDKPEWIRFHLSPAGGGRSFRDGLTSTAWDFEYIIPDEEYEVGKWYKLRVRLIFKQYEGDDDVLAEVRKAQRDLGFRTVADLKN